MSLSRIVEYSEVKTKLRESFPKPRYSHKGTMKAPPLSTNYSGVGTAFDYVLRFYIKRNNQDVNDDKWVANYSLDLIEKNSQLHSRAKSLLDDANKNYVDYLKTGEMTDQLLASALHLSQLDLVFRIGCRTKDLGRTNPLDVLDLRNLYNAIDPKLFNVKRSCVLNPTFGEGSHIVGGADCDLFIDGMLIDIKTSKHLKFERYYFNQLVGYYLLSTYGGIDGAPDEEIDALGIYFSRYSILRSFPIEVITDKPLYQDTRDWFIEYAKEKTHYDKRMEQ